MRRANRTGLPKRTCEQRECEVLFTPTRQHQKFCSTACRNTHHESFRLVLTDQDRRRLQLWYERDAPSKADLALAKKLGLQP